MQFEYKVVPAPRKGEKLPGVRTAPDRFALTLSSLMNALGREGWEYLRAETLPCEERVGLTGRTTVFQNMLIFRRQMVPAQTAVTSAAPVLATQPAVPAPVMPPAAPALAVQARDLVDMAAIARPVPLQPIGRRLAEFAALPSRPLVFRKLTADAPQGEAPRISLVPQPPEAADAFGTPPGKEHGQA